MQLREVHCPHRIRPVRTLLANQREGLLAFAKQLDEDLRALSEDCAVPVSEIREVLEVQCLGGQPLGAMVARTSVVITCGRPLWGDA